jgi:two-component system, cell cycle sensor histidine kinase and response regulator CckA
MTTASDKAKILIVEDEAVNAKLIRARIQSLGHIAVGPALTGEAAIRMALEEKPDLILMDIGLQGEMDGIEAAKIIKDKISTQIIYITAYSEEEFIKRAKPTIPHGYLLKPFHGKELNIAVEMALYAGKLDAERRRMEESLRESENKYRRLFHHAPVGIYEVDFIRNRIVDVNDMACQLTGYGRDELLCIDPLDLLGPRSKQHFLDHLETIRQGKTVSNSVEYEIITKSKEIKHALLSVSFICQHGRITRASVVAHDITEKKQAKEKLEQSEQKARAYKNDLEIYFNLTPLGIIIFDNDFKVVSWNPGAEKIFGYSAEEAIGQDTFEILVPDYEQERVKSIHLISDPKVTVNVNDNKTKDGRIITIQWFNSPRLDAQGNLTGLIAACQDISDRKQAEDRLRQSEEKYRATFESIPDIVTITRMTDGRYSYVNETFCQITGYSREEVLGRTPGDINLYADFEDRRHMMNELRENGMLLNYEVRFRKKDGTFFDSLFSARRLSINDEDCLVALTKDVTEQKVLESEKRMLEEQLEQAKKMEAIGTLAGGIAHDFNNLLQAISGYTQLLMMDEPEGTPTYSNLKAILESSARASDLVKQLLLFSRKADSVRESVELNREVEKARRILERTIPKMVDMEVRTSGRLWRITADPVQVEQIMLNLGTNAADAMPDGGTLIFETANVTLVDDLSTKFMGVQPGNYVLLSVSDTGHGMDDETKEKMFDPFFTTKPFGKGTGLGLASVYGIVKSHGGCITCDSELGIGTTFNIYLPAVEAPALDADEKMHYRLPAGGCETVLLVDDEAAIRDITAMALKKYGYTPVTASSGEEALDIFTKQKDDIDLIILDLGMPGMGGYRCLRELLNQDPAVRVIIASGYAVDGQIKKAVDAGAKGFVAKPYQIRNLLDQVRKVLDGGKEKPDK